MAFLKALIPGLALTFVVSLILGSNGSNGGWLEISQVRIESLEFYWSVPLFVISTAGSWGIFKMME